MELPSVTNVFRKKKASDNFGYICISVGIPGGGKSIPRSLGVKILEKEWEPVTESVKSSNPNYSQINRDISDRKQELIDLFKAEGKRGVKFTEQYIKEKLNPPKAGGSFMRFYGEYIELIASRYTDGYAKHFLGEYNSLKTFAGERIDFADITTEFLERYERSLNVVATTLHTKTKRLKEVIKKAVERGFITNTQIAGYKLPKYVEPETRYLTLEQTEKLANKVYDGEFSDDSTMLAVACYFLIECYSGIRFSDWRRFRVEKLVNKRNFRVRTKKNKEPVYLPLNSFKRLARIVDYVIENEIEFNITEQATNRLLKILGKSIKFTDLTTHIGRHTCGVLLGEMGYTTRAIAEILGITENTAKRYVKATRQGIKLEIERHGGL